MTYQVTEEVDQAIRKLADDNDVSAAEMLGVAIMAYASRKPDIPPADSVLIRKIIDARAIVTTKQVCSLAGYQQSKANHSMVGKVLRAAGWDRRLIMVHHIRRPVYSRPGAPPTEDAIRAFFQERIFGSQQKISPDHFNSFPATVTPE